jgi:hypothetical protein
VGGKTKWVGANEFWFGVAWCFCVQPRGVGWIRGGISPHSHLEDLKLEQIEG